MALQSTIDRINDAVVALAQTKDLLLRGGDIPSLGSELVRSRRAWLEARIAHRRAFLAEKEIDNEVIEGERYDLAFETYNATADAERSAYAAYERAVRAFDAAVGCVD